MSQGFTDRRGINDRAQGAPAGGVAPDAELKVIVVVNLIDTRPLSILVSDTAGLGITCWLPRSKISVEAARTGRVVRIVMPRWLAQEKQLWSEAGEGQGQLF